MNNFKDYVQCWCNVAEEITARSPSIAQYSSTYYINDEERKLIDYETLHMHAYRVQTVKIRSKNLFSFTNICCNENDGRSKIIKFLNKC